MAELIEVGPAGSGDLWGRDDLAGIFQHQLDAPLSELELLNGGLKAELGATQASKARPLRRFRDLFVHPEPPLDLLQSVKVLAKRCRKQPELGVPPPVATVLYFLSVVTALVAHGEHITELDQSALERGIRWTLALPWIDQRTREMFERGLALVRGHTADDR